MLGIARIKKRAKDADAFFKAADQECDILLIQCPPWDIVMPPLGVVYLSGYLKKCGFSTAVFDVNIAAYHLVDDGLKYLWDQRSYQSWVSAEQYAQVRRQLESKVINVVLRSIQKMDTDIIGLSVNFAGIAFSTELIKAIKKIKPLARIIVGGWASICRPMRELFPQGLVDVFVVGEGEQTLVEVLQVLKSKKEPVSVSGAIFKDSPFPYSPRQAIINLDEIPWPTFAELDLGLYSSRSLPLFTSRGCIGCCAFCNDWPLSRPYRDRSAENVFSEINFHRESNKIEVFSFKDLTCNGNIRRLARLADLLIAKNLKIHWDSQAITLKEMTPGLLNKLRKSGCECLIYGVESFSNNTLKRMRKLFTGEIAERVIQDTFNSGIKVMINIIIGFPGETEDDFQQTIEAVKRNRGFIYQIGAISTCLINNDSELEKNRDTYKLILPNSQGDSAKEWYSIDRTNTYAVRRQRAERFLAMIDTMKLSYVTKTV